MMKKFRQWRILWVVGLVSLVGSTAGAIFALNPNAGADPGKPRGPNDPNGRHGSVVFYGHVDVEMGVIPLFPSQQGRIVEVTTQENKPVKKGEVLLKLDDRLARLRLREAEADVKAGQAQLDEARKATKQHEAKTAQQQAAIEAMEARLAAAKQGTRRVQELIKDKLLKETSPEAITAEKLVGEAEAGVKAEKARMTELALFDPNLPIARAEADLAARQSRREQAQLGVDECLLVAPSDGEVLQVLVGPGSVLSAQVPQPAINFCPASPRIVRAEIEQEFANRVSPNGDVLVQDENGASAVWKGKIVRIADWFTKSRSQDAFRLMNQEVRTLECIVALEQTPGLRLGQRVRVTAGSLAAGQ